MTLPCNVKRGGETRVYVVEQRSRLTLVPPSLFCSLKKKKKLSNLSFLVRENVVVCTTGKEKKEERE